MATMALAEAAIATSNTMPDPQGHVKITSCIGLIAVGDRLWDEFGA